jgi:hypothetical protein
MSTTSLAKLAFTTPEHGVTSRFDDSTLRELHALLEMALAVLSA